MIPMKLVFPVLCFILVYLHGSIGSATDDLSERAVNRMCVSLLLFFSGLTEAAPGNEGFSCRQKTIVMFFP